MVSSLLVALTGYLAQAACATLMAIVLRVFHRHYRRAYLGHWSWSWWAFCLFLVGGALALQITGLPATSPLRITIATLALFGGYAQTALVLFGTAEAASGRTVGRRRFQRTLLALLGLSLAVVLLTLPLNPAL